MKYILVTGGVISGVGKGVLASSLGAILKGCGFRVTAIKIDPYINIDAGTFSPYEHGEVFVLDDGGEVDLDLGNYERFMEVELGKDNNITTGKIYKAVIKKERKGGYLGETVQIVPHLTNAIQEWVERVARIPVPDTRGEKEPLQEPQICVVELGGTIGDIEGMPFAEAFRQFHNRIGKENFCVVHVSLVPQIGTDGEQKTKPTQMSVMELRKLGLAPDLICCRSINPLEQSVRKKVSGTCDVTPEQVISVHDCKSLYHVPSLLQEQNVIQILCERLQMDIPIHPSNGVAKWNNLAKTIEEATVEVKIAMVGKYTKLKDSYMSVNKALEHAALFCKRKLVIKYIDATNLEEESKHSKDPAKQEQYAQAWSVLKECGGLLVPGGFGTRGIQGKVDAIQWARTNRVPFLGVCLGYQCATIEFARHVLQLENADSTEFDPITKDPVVIEMPEHNPGKMGGTMRLGKRTTIFCEEDSVIKRLYGNETTVEERHRHRYEVNPAYIDRLEERGMRFVGKDDTGKRMEIMELEGHPYFVGVQFHPEYLSRPHKPSPPYVGLLLAASGQLKTHLPDLEKAQRKVVNGVPEVSQPMVNGKKEVEAVPVCNGKKMPVLEDGGGDAGRVNGF
ncbi:CTP synthase 2-like [Paramacrobiotus metropolitanus]|uniref:CTP synthase 2-like n=1 Tax=Paramacrobiotus metropolitanus TaxID=2943436 RepID=UPI0024460AB0|nr:CTP synthase 2-like [Paramacrobiotus metropolitanus]